MGTVAGYVPNTHGLFLPMSLGLFPIGLSVCRINFSDIKHLPHVLRLVPKLLSAVRPDVIYLYTHTRLTAL